ncbi:hypothetical protein [Campylobacter sputorum]|uniref:hypothetical protein n=1 Tax=Campylobacter sputorum TaxID=206 RepID=UPI0014789FE7|nr:hypothetical protein [Campylobacter sputorum]
MPVKQQEFNFYYAIIGFVIMTVANIIAAITFNIRMSKIIPMELLNSLYYILILWLSVVFLFMYFNL